MITLTANSSDVNLIISEINKKIQGIAEIKESVVLTEVANAVFSITSKKFIQAMNLQAKANPKKYHHLYEWNRVGDNLARLFYLNKISSSNGKLVIGYGFRNSKTSVPIPPQLRTPGTTGRAVRSRHIFVKKAEIMESGRPITYRTKKTQVFIDKTGAPVFVPPRTFINNRYPGGRQVKDALHKFFHAWFEMNATSVVNSSGIMRDIERATAVSLSTRGSGPAQVRSSVISTLKKYSNNEVII